MLLLRNARSLKQSQFEMFTVHLISFGLLQYALGGNWALPATRVLRHNHAPFARPNNEP